MGSRRRHDPRGRRRIASTGRVITAATAIMVCVFLSFRLGDEPRIAIEGHAAAAQRYTHTEPDERQKP